MVDQANAIAKGPVDDARGKPFMSGLYMTDWRAEQRSSMRGRLRQKFWKSHAGLHPGF